MGDRGNIVIRQGTTNADDVWFYTHWSGSEIGEVVKTALARKQRWTDDCYLARIVFCQLVKGIEDEEAGCGISTSMQDNEHPILVVDVPKQCVYYVDEHECKTGRLPDTIQVLAHAVSFAAFINAETVTKP